MTTCPSGSVTRRWLSPTLLAIGVACTAGCDGGKTHELWNDAFHCHGDGGGGPPTPRPLPNSTSESIVHASGGAQEDISGLTENSAIVGEPIQAGAQSSTGTIQVRHGFTPPMPAGAPSGIAQAGTTDSNHSN